MKQINVTHLSDMSGKPDARPVAFSVDGQAFNIDLTEAEVEALKKALKRWVDKARPQKAAKKKRRRNSHAVPTAAIRTWAAENGIEVAPKGRIPASVQEAYAAR